jgi:hypothetical protein
MASLNIKTRSWRRSAFLLKVSLCVLIMGFLADFQDTALFPCQDPRGRALSVGSIPPVTKPLRQDLANTIEIGHYMLYQYGNTSLLPEYLSHPNKYSPLDRKKNNFVAIWPTLASSDFRRRSRTASQTCTPSPGSTSPGNPPRVSLLKLLFCNYPKVSRIPKLVLRCA